VKRCRLSGRKGLLFLRDDPDWVVSVTESTQRAGRGGAILAGIALGVVVAVLILATSPRPSSIKWPPASQVEATGANLTPRAQAGGGVAALASDCTTALVDVDAHLPVEVWLAPAGTPINYNATAFPAPFYFWSGANPVEHLSVVVTVSDPNEGFSLTVFDPSYTQSGPASFGIWFSGNGCPQA